MADSTALKNRILSTAQKQAQEIQERAQKEAQEIRERAQRKVQEEKNRLQERTEEENQQLMDREETMARLALKKEILAQKQEEIQRVFSSLKERIQKMPDNDYQKILAEMLLATVEEGTEEVIFSTRDQKRLGAKFITGINRQLQEKGKKGALKLSEETREMDGGFILKGVGMENNNSFTELLAIQRDDLETQVAAVLFKQ